MVGIPLPSSVDTARRWVAETQKAVNHSSGRRLAAATISSGGLHVYRHGKVLVDEGNLEIIDGDLKLSRGQISGDALKEQIGFDIAGGQNQSFTTPKKLEVGAWQQAAQITATPPNWAKSVVVYASAQFHGAWRDEYIESDACYGQARLRIGKRISPEPYLRMAVIGETANFEASLSLATTVACDGPVRVCVDHWLVNPGGWADFYDPAKSWVMIQAICVWLNQKR